jgi:hypothetical protein
MSMHGNMHAIFEQQHEEGEAFLQWIVRGNETRVHHYEHASKHQSIE